MSVRDAFVAARGLLCAAPLAVLLAALTACTAPREPETLAGWNEDRLEEALPALANSCTKPGALPPALCAAARAVPRGDRAAARAFFDAHFAPDSSAEGLVTGYYEPELAGALSPSARARVPLYRPPPDRTRYDRAAIEAGALRGRGLELLWLDDPVDAFFLHIQGAGRIRLAEGGVVRVGYAGDNGRGYVPIGRLLAERGAIPRDQVSMATIRAWLARDPARGAALMNENPRFIFFRRIDTLSADSGPVGAMGVPLVAGRSIAVDTAQVALGSAVWLETVDPVDGRPLRRLVFAQDRGAAITGAGRADLFWGTGADAGARAGAMRSPGRLTVLRPRSQ